MRILVTVLAVLVLLTPALADRSHASKVFFDAYYLEKAKRDLEGARAAYNELLGAKDLAPNLHVRAWIGLARIAARTGKGDAEAMLGHASEALKRFPGNPTDGFEDERDRVIYDSILKEIKEARTLLAGTKEPDEVMERIDMWISVLASSGEKEQRAEAIDSLTRFSKRAVPRLSETLRSPYPRAVSGAARALVGLGAVGVSPLTVALEDADVLFPAQIAEELRMGHRIHAAAARAAVHHPEVAVRLAGAKALRVIALKERAPCLEVEEALLDALDDKEAEIRTIAISVPSDCWHSANLIRALGKTLGDRDPVVAKGALDTLRGNSGLKGDVPEALHSEILDLLRHDDPDVRREIVHLCGSGGGKLARDAVLRGLTDGDADVRESAAGYVYDGRVGIDEEVASAFGEGVERLIRDDPGDAWLENYSELIRLVGSRRRGDGDRTLLVGPLIEAVSSIHTPRRYPAFNEALWFAVQLDWRKADTAGLLRSYGALASDSDRAQWLRSFSESLGREVVPLAKQALEAKSDELRVEAARILAEALDAEEQRPVLERLVKDSSAQIRAAAILALSRLGEGGAGEKVADAYRAALSDPSVAVRRAAILPALMALEGEALPLILVAVKEQPKLAPIAVQAVAARMKQAEALLFLKKVLPLAGGVTSLPGAEAWAAAERVLTDEMVLEALRRDDMALLLRAADMAGKRNLLDAWPILLEKPKIDQVRGALDRIRTYHLGLKEYQDLKEARGGDAASKAGEMAASPDAGHRRAAAYALGALGDASAIGLLLDLVRDEDAGVREAAMAALKKLGGGGAEDGD